MSKQIHTAEFLYLFSDESGFKFLTHDIQAANTDYIEYIYRCQKELFKWKEKISDDLYNLVKGFLLGPSWTDFEGKRHNFFCCSQETVNYFLETGHHPLSDNNYSSEIDAFRNSVRFRPGKLNKFLLEIKERYDGKLSIDCDSSFRGADFYTNTLQLRKALDEIFSSMAEYADDFPNVHVGFNDSEDADGFSVATITITHEGSFPKHSFDRDRQKLTDGGGTLANIKTALDGYAEWQIQSRWDGDETFRLWTVLPEEKINDSEADGKGFTHVIRIKYKV